MGNKKQKQKTDPPAVIRFVFLRGALLATEEAIKALERQRVELASSLAKVEEEAKNAGGGNDCKKFYGKIH